MNLWSNTPVNEVSEIGHESRTNPQQSSLAPRRVLGSYVVDGTPRSRQDSVNTADSNDDKSDRRYPKSAIDTRAVHGSVL